MSETFDPYRKWLGIQPAEQPPDHYRLLGIVRFEDDADTISNAADRQMAHVRTFQTGPHSVVSQKLLNEIAAARVWLLNAAKKVEYDRQLRAKESPQATAAANRRPMDPPPPPPGPVARVTPPTAVWQPPASAPRIPVPQAQLRETAPNPVGPAPIGVGPVPRRPPPKVNFRQPRREQSDAHKTLFIAAGLAAIALAVFVAYKVRSGGNGNLTPDVVVANQLIEDDADKARAVRESPQASQSKVVVTGTPVDDEESPQHEAPPPAGSPSAPQPPVDEATDPSSIWATLTRQLNDLGSWKPTSGEWSEKSGRIFGAGDSRLTFQEELPDAFLLSFEMKVVEGMRPRVIFGEGSFHFGNEGYDRTLFVHDGIALPIVGAPRPYETGVPLRIVCRLTAQEVEFLVNDKLVARCGRQRPGPVQLILSAGDFWSKGQVLFGSFTLGPAPPTPLTPRGSSNDSVDLLALVDVARDQVSGEWEREDTALLSPAGRSARLQLPYSPGGDYELTVVAERLSGTNSFVIGLVIGGRQVAMTLDGYDGAISGLADLDKHDGATNESTRRGKRLPPGQPHTVVCTVHEGSVRVTCDGQEALTWSGDAVRLSNTVFYDVPDKRRLYLGAWESQFKYTRIEVRPLPVQGRSEYRPIRIQSAR